MVTDFFTPEEELAIHKAAVAKWEASMANPNPELVRLVIDVDEIQRLVGTYRHLKRMEGWGRSVVPGSYEFDCVLQSLKPFADAADVCDGSNTADVVEVSV